MAENRIPEINEKTSESTKDSEPNNYFRFLKRKWLIPGLFLIGLIIGASSYLLLSNNTTRACTMEAKLCPDGSSVGRTGPNCEFAACPAQVENMTPSLSPVVEPSGEQVFCAQDVRECPDGSYVSRKPPTCEFAACPPTCPEGIRECP